ncbi:transferase, transferring glycosyl group [Trypanosoma theileri]|uniref:Transferase, transferring glycosyl group n=1 Tax=Trypanosoma theileri TaxID=67003 RepID=A0A1X0P469_9TRYP|nr:transferase, transferring glycosyl group [Trypanosoma theileri]ORC91727.1 transferase, transferring glycosyl group [Trypanosoma theileri]
MRRNMTQNWFRPHPFGVYPRGNARDPLDLTIPRFGTLSSLQGAAKGQIVKSGISGCEPTEEAFLDLILHLLSFCSVDDICRISGSCTGWYCLIHASDAFKQAYGLISPNYLRFRRSWKDSAIQCFLSLKDKTSSDDKNCLLTRKNSSAFCTDNNNDDDDDNKMTKIFIHRPFAVKRVFFNDQLFQAWLCTILPCHYHLRPAIKTTVHEEDAAWPNGANPIQEAPRFRTALKEVPRCSGLTPNEFRKRFEEPNLPVILTDVAVNWPMFRILEGNFKNLATKAKELFRSNASLDVPMRCEHTTMTVSDYVRYAVEQSDERPIYMFDAEFGTSMAADSLYTVPEHFGRDDFFKVLGKERPKYRWIIAGPKRGGSSFHVDPNYTNAWNANLTGRKRWILFPPGCTPAGVFPSEDMSEVTTPVSLTEWLLNHYDATVEKWKGVGYECICEPGDIMFIPCGWWHFVINLEDSVAITQNYVSECNLPSVMKFLSAMKSSISGIDEDADNTVGAMVEKRRANFADEFAAAMHSSFPDLMKRVETDLEKEAQLRRERKRTHVTALPLLDAEADGFTFNF